MQKVPLYKQIKNDIKAKIVSGELKAGDLVPSEAEIMNNYQVSQITAKNALTSLVDDGSIYRIQGKGSFVSREPDTVEKIAGSSNAAGDRKQGGMIGVLFPYLKKKLEHQLIYYLDQFIYAQGYQMLLHNCNENEQEESRTLEQFLDLNVKGLIIFPVVNEQYNENILRLSLDKFPLVLIDRYFKGINAFHVASDNFKGAYDVVSRLLDQGHRRIAYISPEITNSTTEDRASGFEHAFQDKNLPIDKNLWLTNLNSTDSDEDLNSLLAFYKSHPDVTAIFTANIHMLDLTVAVLRQLDKKVPEDVEVFTFDEPNYPNVNYVLQDYETIAKSAVDLLIAQMQAPAAAAKEIVVPVKLIARQAGD